MAVITKKDGRIVRTGRHYTEFRQRIYDYQDGICYLCPKWWTFDTFQVHHQGERGLGGSRRNDVAWFDVHQAKLPMVKGLAYGLCVECHRSVDSKKLYAVSL